MEEVFAMAKTRTVERFTEAELEQICREFGIKIENKAERDADAAGK